MRGHLNVKIIQSFLTNSRLLCSEQNFSFHGA